MKLKYDIEESKSQCMGGITSTMGNSLMSSTIGTGAGGIMMVHYIGPHGR